VPVIAVAARQPCKDLERFRHAEVPACVGCDRQGVVGVSVGLVEFALSHRDIGAGHKHRQPMRAQRHDRGVIRPLAGGEELATSQKCLDHGSHGPRIDRTLWDGVVHGRFARRLRCRGVPGGECCDGHRRVDGVLVEPAHRGRCVKCGLRRRESRCDVTLVGERGALGEKPE
jgi:hypothetical protein